MAASAQTWPHQARSVTPCRDDGACRTTSDPAPLATRGRGSPGPPRRQSQRVAKHDRSVSLPVWREGCRCLDRAAHRRHRPPDAARDHAGWPAHRRSRLRAPARAGRFTAEIGYWLGEAHWGRGLAPEALRLATDYAFAEFNFVRLQAGVLDWNPRSRRVLEKVGYRLEGRLVKAVVKDGAIIDRWLYARLRDDSPTFVA